MGDDRCGACGAALERGAVFCAECGARVSDFVTRGGVPGGVPGDARGGEAGAFGARDATAAGSPAEPALPPVPPVPGVPPARPTPVPPPAAALPPIPPPPIPPPPSAPFGARSTYPRAAAFPASGASAPPGGVAVAPGAVAPVGRRVGAFAIDVTVTAVALGIGFVVALRGASGATGAGGTVSPALFVGYLPVFAVGIGLWISESLTGATVGGALLGIRTLSAATGRPAGLWRILLRQLVVGLGGVVCLGQWVVVASGAWDRTVLQRGWHDKAAGTMVLRAGAGAAPVGDPSGVYASAVARAVGQPADGPVPGSGVPRVSVPGEPAASPEPGATTPDGAGGQPPAHLPSPYSAGPAVAGAVPSPPAPGVPLLDTYGPIAPVEPETIAPVAPIPVPSFARDVAASRETGAHRAPGVEGLIAGPPGTASSPRSATVPVAASSSAPSHEPAAAPWPGASAPPVGLGGPVPSTTGPAPSAPDGLGDLEHTRLRPSSPPPAAQPVGAPEPLRLAFDTGELVDVEGDGLVGRNPGAADGVAHLVAIDDPARSVSKVHLAFGLDGAADRLWVVDRGSTNGTVLVRPDGTSIALPAGARASVAAGWAIRFGERTVRVERR